MLLLCIVSKNYAQSITEPTGNKYIRALGSACKTFPDGGCLITTYETMSFSPDSVYINRYTKAECDSKKIVNKRYEGAIKIGTYSYQTQKKKNSDHLIIRIDGYQIGSFELSNDHLEEFVNLNNPSSNNNSNRVIFSLAD